MKYYIIYQITNIVNDKIYIGKHETTDIRDGYMGSGKLLNRSYKKYGFEQFIKTILFVFDNEEEMNLKEQELVTPEFCLREDTYNICPGGKGGFGYINSKKLNVYGNNGANGKLSLTKATKILQEKRTSPEFIDFCSKRIKDALKKYYYDGGQNGFKGKSHSAKTKEKISLASKEKNVGSKNSQYGSVWITDGVNNKKIKNNTVPNGWYKGRTMK